MTRTLRPDERRIWALVASTVRPAPGRSLPPEAERSVEPMAPMHLPPLQAAPPRRPGRLAPPDVIEPNRKQQIMRRPLEADARLDLHGYDQDRARAALVDFLHRASRSGHRAVLIITGKGIQGEGVLRRRVPQWLSCPTLALIVAGVSVAHARHGGDGALYVALKRHQARRQG